MLRCSGCCGLWFWQERDVFWKPGRILTPAFSLGSQGANGCAGVAWPWCGSRRDSLVEKLKHRHQLVPLLPGIP